MHYSLRDGTFPLIPLTLQAHAMTPFQGAGAGQAIEVCTHVRIMLSTPFIRYPDTYHLRCTSYHLGPSPAHETTIGRFHSLLPSLPPPNDAPHPPPSPLNLLPRSRPVYEQDRRTVTEERLGFRVEWVS